MSSTLLLPHAHSFVKGPAVINTHTFNRVPGAPPRDGLGVTYLPFTISSDAGYADLPLVKIENSNLPTTILQLLHTNHDTGKEISNNLNSTYIHSMLYV